MTQTHEQYMEAALEIARKAEEHGDVPVGVVIVKDGQIIARSEPRVMIDNDPTAHAEMLAIRQATAALGKPHLTGCTMFDTFECCPMCCGAIMNSGIDTLVIGGRFEGSDRSYGGYSVEQLLSTTRANRRIDLIDGILRERCNALFTVDKRDDWLRRMRGDNPGWERAG